MTDAQGRRGDSARRCRDDIATSSRQRRDAVATAEGIDATVTRHVVAGNPTKHDLPDP